ncbi:MAG TPA: hypothetical protein VGB20_06865 [bacterium]
MREIETQLKARYGWDAVIGRLGELWLVHLDQPSQDEIRERIEEARQDFFDDPEDCPCCEMIRPQAGDILVFDGPMCQIERAPWRKQIPDQN